MAIGDGQRRPFRAERQLMEKRSQTSPDEHSDVQGMVGITGDFRQELDSALADLRGRILSDIKGLMASAPTTVKDAGEEGDPIHVLKGEIKDVAEAIQQTKVELGALVQTSENNPRIETVRSELRAVVAGQETATGSILDCMETIEEAAQQVKQNDPVPEADAANKELCDIILDNVVKVFEHCNFQDLSGQRITKVINTLNFIDERVHQIMTIWGQEEIMQHDVADEERGQDNLDKILAKPTAEVEKISQDEIDKMFG